MLKPVIIGLIMKSAFFLTLIFGILTSFAIGYFVKRARSRRIQMTPPTPESADAELSFLEKEALKLRNAVSKLLATEGFGLPTETKSANKTVVVVNESKRGRGNKVSSKSQPVSGPHDSGSDALSRRLKKLKEEVTGMVTDVTLVVNLKNEPKQGIVVTSRPDMSTEVQDRDSDSVIRRARSPQFDDDFWPQSDSGESNSVSGVQIRSDEPIILRRYQKDAGSKIIDLYNQAVTDNIARERFREVNQPLRVGTVNAVERRQNPTATIKPKFKETTDGDFFAFSTGPNQYAVVPRLGLTIGPVSYHAGALGEMFGNPDYDPLRSYSRYQVRKPAIFKRDGDRWELLSPGELDLGPGD